MIPHRETNNANDMTVLNTVPFEHYWFTIRLKWITIIVMRLNKQEAFRDWVYVNPTAVKNWIVSTFKFYRSKTLQFFNGAITRQNLCGSYISDIILKMSKTWEQWRPQIYIKYWSKVKPQPLSSRAIVKLKSLSWNIK